MQEPIKLVFDSFMLESYLSMYFKKFPNRKKNPLEWLGKTQNGMLPSWNRMLNCPNRIVQNQWKQSLAEYSSFVINYNDLNDMNIDRCLVLARQYRPTKAKSDGDNCYVKATLDAMVKHNVIIEDNYYILNPFVVFTGYDKHHPRTEILIFKIDDQNTYEEVLNEAIKYLQ